MRTKDGREDKGEKEGCCTNRKGKKRETSKKNCVSIFYKRIYYVLHELR